MSERNGRKRREGGGGGREQREVVGETTGDSRVQNERVARVTWPCLRFFGALFADSAPIPVPPRPFRGGPLASSAASSLLL